MLVLVAYDISTTAPAGTRRLQAVAKAMKDHGIRVQKSVWECDVDPAGWTKLRTRLLATIDPEVDSLRVYLLGNDWERRIEHHGANKPPDTRGLLLID